MLNIKLPQKKKKNFTTFLTGLIAGLILPLLTVLGFYLIRFSGNKTITEFIEYLRYYDVTTKIISLCVLPNLLLFFVFMWTNRYEPAKGVILSALIYTIFVLILN